MREFCLTLILGLAITIPCTGGQARPCPHCGCTQLKKVCRLVPDVKKVTETKYTVDAEEVCLPGKSCIEERVVCDPCALHGERIERTQIPRCGDIVCKKKLKKTTTTVEKPTFKCVLDTICCQCGECCDTSNCSR